MAKVLFGAAMVGTLSLSGVVVATAGPQAGTMPAVLTVQGPEIALAPQDSTMVTVPDGSRAYVAGTGTLTAYDLASGNALATIPLPGIIGALTASRDGSTIFASSYGSGEGSILATISTATNTVVKTVPIADTAYTIAESADGASVVLLGEGSPKKLYVIDPAAGTVTKTIPLPADREALAVWTSPGDDYAYVSRLYVTSPSTSVSDILVIDVETGLVVRSIEPCDVASAMAFSKDGATAYVACGDGVVAVVQTATGSILDTIDVGFQASFAQLTSGGTRLIVAGNLHKTVGEIDTATNTLVSTATAAGSVGRLSAPFDGDRAWFIQGNEGGSAVLRSLAVEAAGEVVPTETPSQLPPTSVPPTTVPPTEEQAPGTTTAPAPNSNTPVASASAVAVLAATGPGTVLPLVAAALLLIIVGGAAMGRRRMAH